MEASPPFCSPPAWRTRKLRPTDRNLNRTRGTKKGSAAGSPEIVSPKLVQQFWQCHKLFLVIDAYSSSETRGEWRHIKDGAELEQRGC